MNLKLYRIPVPLGLAFLRKKANVNPLIVNYHMVSDADLPHVNKLYSYRNIPTFLTDLDYFTLHYKVISLYDLLGSLEGRSTLPENALLITFDDGFREVYDPVAPILKQRGIPATFFLTTNFINNKELDPGCKKSLIINAIESDPTLKQIRLLDELLSERSVSGNNTIERIRNIPFKQRSVIEEAASVIGIDFNQYLQTVKPYLETSQIHELVELGFTFGGHSVNHPRYSEISLEEQIDQTISSVEVLTHEFGLTYKVFAFPHTDRGITTGFYEKIGDRIDATFGLPGLIPDLNPSNFQRIGVENGNYYVRRTIKYHYLRKIYHTAKGGKQT